MIASENGHALDTDTISKNLSTYLNLETPENYSASYRTSIIKPKWSTKDVKKVNTIITGFSTSFVSSTPRGKNIKIAASRLNNRFLYLGDSISFLDVLYQDEDGKSYETSNGFLNGKVVPAVGGGICQVSTTAYSAFLFAGILPTTRYPHSMTVSYSPLGLDAALSVGGKDLVVKNTLNAPLLIKAKVSGNRLTIRLKSYKNVLNGYHYQPRSVQLSPTMAKAYLDVYKDGKKVKTIFLSKDEYLK